MMNKKTGHVNHLAARFSTLAVHGGEEGHPHNPLSVPIYQNAVFAFDEVADTISQFETGEGYIYSRIGNPTVDAFEKKMTLLEGGEAALAFASGMAAISAVFMTVAKPGEHLLVARSMYSGTHSLIAHQLRPMGYEVDFFDAAGTDGVRNLAKAIREKTKLVYFESPSNPQLEITDIEALARVAKERGITTAIDNTFATPYLQRPLSKGVDVVIHSATKYIGGHGDAVGGVVVGKERFIHRMRHGIRRDLGGILAPMHAWLYLRGLKTLPLRMDRHCDSAMKVARFLETHPSVDSVIYPGLASHPDHELATRQMKAFGGVVSFRLASREQCRKLCDTVQLCTLGVSLGDAATLIQHAASMFHHKESDEQCEKKGVDPLLIRLSVGLEDPEDIIDDLKQALEKSSP